MKKLLLFVFISINALGQSDVSNLEIQKTIDSSLAFIQKTQIKTTDIKSFAGEWPVFMDLDTWYVFLGKKQKAQDSNCFTLAAIHNFLSEIYLADTSKVALKPVLANAYSQLKFYENDLKFGFWRKFERKPNQDLIRRPTNFRLKSRLVQKMANVPEDADDTSLANTATYFHNKIFGENLPQISYEIFDKFADNNRKNVNWYNLTIQSKVESGAFMTWLAKEKEYKRRWNAPKILVNTVFIFLPFAKAYPHKKQQWIPFGANDVDVVVNANVLNYLAKNQILANSKAAEHSIKMINNWINSKHWQETSVYYPNRYHTHFAVARAFGSGVPALKPACDAIVKDIISNQNADGSLESKHYINNSDKVESTANALYALLTLKKSGYDIDKKPIEKAIHFLLGQKKTNADGTSFWDGGVYFSGGTCLRNILFWKSDAYTTALIISSLQKYLESQKSI